MDFTLIVKWLQMEAPKEDWVGFDAGLEGNLLKTHHVPSSPVKFSKAVQMETLFKADREGRRPGITHSVALRAELRALSPIRESGVPHRCCNLVKSGWRKLVKNLCGKKLLPPKRLGGSPRAVFAS
jgi:hypothetical protein